MNWPLLQTGIGIDFPEGDFQAIYVKRQWNRIRVADRLEIPHYKQLGPRECGKLYREFLRKNGLRVPWTVVALPRSAVLLRSLRFPRAVGKDLSRAVEYQVDSLHPFEEGSVYWDFSVWRSPERSLVGKPAEAEGETDGRQFEVPVAIAEKKHVGEMASWFEEAGIAVSQFTVTTAALFAALWSRLGAESGKGRGFFILCAGSESFELIGYVPGMALLSRELVVAAGAAPPEEGFRAAVARELELARCELRVEPEEHPPVILCGKNLPLEAENFPFTVASVEQFFPRLSVGAPNFHLGEHAVGFAAALTAVDRRLPLSFNLLPEEKRAYQSPLAPLPTYALSGLVVLLAVALGLRGTLQDWLFDRYLEREMQALRPQLQEVETAREESQRISERLALLDGARNTAALPLDILGELTRLLPEDVWLQQVQYEGDSLVLQGQAVSASGLLQTLAHSGSLESPQFLSAINRMPDGTELFRIGLRIRTATR